jgi:assimilatory nitrate reductase catalytic subunit
MFEQWDSPEAVFELLKELSKDRPCDFTGIKDYRMIDETGGIQWPFFESGSQSRPTAREHRLFEDHKFYHPDGRAKFIHENPRPLTEPPNANFPFILLTGRGTASQWHTQTRTGKSAVLRKLYPEHIYVEINPTDARKLGIGPNEWVLVESQRGSLRAKSFVTPTVGLGQIFIPMHYKTTNQLTDSVVDPYSKQPSYKACAVRVRREN